MKNVAGVGVVAFLFAMQPACGGGGTAAPATAIALCEQQESLACEQAFPCTPTAMQDANFKAFFGTSVADCKSMVQADCADTKCVGTYTASLGATCISKMRGLGCQVLDKTVPLPLECDQACPQ